MHLHFEKNANTRCDCSILSLSWMGKVPDDIPEEEGWKLNRTNYYQEGWLATGNIRGIVGVTFTTSHCKKNMDYPLRTNYNLRGHRSDVILVKWNEPYQKLASCDSSGIIFVWIKYEGRWSIELINDRNTPVTHFSWSHDGRMALICYQDGFVLVGSVAGQRYWSSMLNLDATITCGIWTPDDQQVYFGTTQGQIIVMDVHGAMVSQVQLCSDVGITAMSWSCEKFKMEEGEDTEPGVTNASKRTFVLAVSFQNGFIYLLKSFDDVSPAHINTSLNGALGLVMEWSNSRELLAVAGTALSTPVTAMSTNAPNTSNGGDHTSTNNAANNVNANTATTTAAAAAAASTGPTIYDNLLKFYTESGVLLYTARIPNTNTAVSALTWGHNDKRIFIATGTQVHIAWVSRRVASLQLLCRLQIQTSLTSEIMLPKLPLPSRIKSLIGNLFAQTIRCCVPDLKALREFVSRPPTCSTRLHCTMIRHDDETNISSGTCYTLYLEYLGGLVPLLKGKRTSKIRPEFVIFDPQVDDTQILFQSSPDSITSITVPAKSSSGSSQSTTANGRTDSSDSDLEDGCRGSPRLPRKRKPRGKRRPPAHHHQTPNGEQLRHTVVVNEIGADTTDELAYVDTLPEDVRLVEVTSNIWGTKFKIHGLAKTVPANLGQVTYKTSLLHLQPRQMTLVITELRDDCAPGPDPTFNPNLFSEDEEEAHAVTAPSVVASAVPRRLTETAPPIAPMSPRPNRFTARLKSPRPEAPAIVGAATAAASGCSASGLGPLAKMESYEDEVPFVDGDEAPLPATAMRTAKNAGDTTRQSSSYANFVAQYSRSASTSGGQSRHAISPLYCEGAVPPLQSPKNAVAPSDIIFDRPPAAGQTTLMNYSTTSDYSSAASVVQVKNALLAGDCLPRPSAHVTPVPLNLNLNLVESRAKERPVTVGRRKDLQYIDEESSTPGHGAEPSAATRCMRRTPTIVSISPATHESITRSCSVGYLDNVEMVPSDVALSLLRKDAPNKRLILVDRKPQSKKSKKFQDELKRTKLNKCGKSKSLDSWDLVDCAATPLLDTKAGHQPQPSLDAAPPSQPTRADTKLNGCGYSKTPILNRKEKPKVCVSCKIISPTVNSTETVCASCKKTQRMVAVLDNRNNNTQKNNNNNNNNNSSTLKVKADIVGETLAKSQAGPSQKNASKKSENLSYFNAIKELAEKRPAAVHKKKTEVITSYTDSPLFSRKHRFADTEDKSTMTIGRKADTNAGSGSSSGGGGTFNFSKQFSGCRRKKRSSSSSGAATVTGSGSAGEDQTPQSPRNLTPVEVTPVEQRTSVSLHTQALTTLENIISRLRDFDEGRLTPPSSPHGPKMPRSSPASPAPSKKGKRHQSSSPIRHILNSPLLNRRHRKKQTTESSDDEQLHNQNGNGATLEQHNHPNGDESAGKQYRDLETFQKAQLRQKLKRGKIEPNGTASTSLQPAPLRREFVMHNKAPMWNENSQVYQLDFGGRVTQESAKNFQIEFRGKQVMQFGRIDGNAYTLDFQYPFSALQAFAVALANVTQRLK